MSRSARSIPGVTADMHELILRLWEENRMTIFMVSHDIQESFQLGTRLLTFDKLRARSAVARGLRRERDLRHAAVAPAHASRIDHLPA